MSAQCDGTKFFQIKKMPDSLHRAIKTVASMQGMSMTEWVMKTLTAAVKRHIEFEEGE